MALTFKKEFSMDTVFTAIGLLAAVLASYINMSNRVTRVETKVDMMLLNSSHGGK